MLEQPCKRMSKTKVWIMVVNDFFIIIPYGDANKISR